jgi:predicted permease
MAVWGIDAVLTFMPPLPEGIRIAADIHLDWRVLAYTLLFATATGVLFGLAPALHSSRTPLSTVLKDDSAGTPRLRSSRTRMALLVGQVAISALLLIGAGLVLRSLENVRPVKLGFDSEQVVVAPIVLDDATSERRERHQLYERLSDAVEALPGVRAVTLVEGMPGGDFLGRTRRSVVVEGRTPAAGEDLEVDAAIVGPEYFTNMNVPVVAGRDFSRADRDGAPCVAIVNGAFAERYFEGAEAAVGKRLARSRTEAADATRLCEIIGVVRDDRWQSLQAAPRPFFALPLLQSDPMRMTMLVHTSTDPASFVPSVRGVLRRIDPDIPIADVKTLRAFFEAASFPFRLLGFVVGGCGLIALLLAAVGVYGAVAHSVAQRMREVGIRMALGALHGDVLRLVVGHAMALVGAGLAIGLLLGLALTRVLVRLPLDTPLLFGVSATDGMTFAGVALLLALVGFVASYLPARRATRGDPVAILRSH